MKLYSAKIRLAGNSDNEVLKHNMSAAELKILEFIHAGKAQTLVDVKHTGDVNRTESRERTRLSQIYSKSTQDAHLNGAQIVEKLFGVASQPLPAEYAPPVFAPIETYNPDAEGVDEVITPVVEEDEPMPVRSPVPKKSALDELTG